MLVQNPQDFLALCQIIANLAQPIIDGMNVILNALGFFIPGGRDVCLGLYDIVNQIYQTFIIFPF